MGSLEIDAALALEGHDLLAALVALPESQWFERKSGRVNPKDLAVPLVAMANADGGTIVVGLHDGQPDLPGAKKINDLRQACVDHCVPPVRARVEERRVPDLPDPLLIFHVDPGEQVHQTANGQCYLRIGDESRRLGVSQQQELMFDRGNSHFEATPVRMSIDDLDARQVSSYATATKAHSGASILQARDLLTRRGEVTTAACLLFAERPQLEFPSAHVRVLRYGDGQRGIGASMTLEDGADVRVEGSLPHQIQQAAEIIEGFMPKWNQLGPAGLFEPRSRIPRDAWLEALVNAVVHRSYSMGGDHVRFEIFPNRVEVTSPGRFPGVVDPSRPLEISRYARNPRIARVCSDLGITRELGEGIRRMYEEMRRVGLTDPVYQQLSGAVKVTLAAADAVPDDVLARLTRSARDILTALRIAGIPQGTGALADAAGVTRMTATRALAQLVDEGLVAWEGTSKRDPRAVWRLA